MKLSEVAKQLGAQLEPADADVEITGVAGIEEAGAGQLTFVANPKYAAAARITKAAAVIVAPEFHALATPTLRCSDPYLAFARSIEFFYRAPQYAPGVHPTAVIDPAAKVAEGASKKHLPAARSDDRA